MTDSWVDLAGLVLTFAPLLLIMLLANWAEQRREQGEPHQAMAWAAYALTLMTYLTGVFFGIAVQLIAAILRSQPGLLEEIAQFSGGASPISLDSTGLLGLGVWLPSLLGMLFLASPVRRLVARVIPIDAKSPVHAVALSWTMLVVVNLTFTLGIGLGNLTDVLEEQAAQSGASVMIMLWVQQLLTALLAMLGVGWLTRRRWASALQRLGIVRPTARQVWIGLAWGLALVPLIMMLEAGAAALGWGASPDVDALTEELLGPLFTSPLGIITLGAAAALGEETLFRGAVQPRFGLVLTAMLFALLHSNYGLTVSTLIVFVLGLVLGYLRKRHNTTTSMITHAVYNMTLGLIAMVGASMLNV
jgi:membrane protease YdiL (CAAX protease family)